MRTKTLNSKLKKFTAAATMGAALQFGGCDFSNVDFATDPRFMVTALIDGFLINPINAFIDDRVDALFDQLLSEDRAAFIVAADPAARWTPHPSMPSSNPVFTRKALDT